jgi:hypothetical protein
MGGGGSNVVVVKRTDEIDQNPSIIFNSIYMTLSIFYSSSLENKDDNQSYLILRIKWLIYT